MTLNQPEYLGDSVYAEWDGYHVILTTRNGYPDDPRNRIALEGEVWAKLVEYAERVERASKHQAYLDT